MPAWQKLTPNNWILSVIEAGFRLPWADSRPPLLLTPPPSLSRLPRDPEVTGVLDAEVQALLAKGAIEPVRDVSPGFFGRLFCVPKSSGGHRPVLDLSSLNRFLEKIPFRMETMTSIREGIQPGDWAASIDLSDAYYHLLIHSKDRKFLRFAFRGRIFQFRALPFGLSLAPWVFTRVVRELMLSLRRQGIRVRAYLDDWLVLAQAKALCAEHVATVSSQALALGFRLNWKKSDLEPKQQFTFLGMSFDTLSMMVKPSEERLERLSRTLNRLLRL